jgi:hypothetical protein
VHKAAEAVDDGGKATPAAVDTNAPLARRAGNAPVEKDSDHVDRRTGHFFRNSWTPGVKDAAVPPGLAGTGGNWR